MCCSSPDHLDLAVALGFRRSRCSDRGLRFRCRMYAPPTDNAALGRNGRLDFGGDRRGRRRRGRCGTILDSIRARLVNLEARKIVSITKNVRMGETYLSGNISPTSEASSFPPPLKHEFHRQPQRKVIDHSLEEDPKLEVQPDEDGEDKRSPINAQSIRSIDVGALENSGDRRGEEWAVRDMH